jgi:hypothetical protein
MGDRQDHDSIGFEAMDDLVREPIQHQVPDGGADPAVEHAGKTMRLNSDRGLSLVHRIEEFQTQTLPLLLVEPGGIHRSCGMFTTCLPPG